MYLALKEGELAAIAEIAENYSISKTHLMKVAHQLGVGRFIETVRGRCGGLRLAKPAKAIGLGEIVRRSEPNIALVPCFKPIDDPCVIQSCCVLKKALDRASVVFFDVLDGYSLSDLVKPRTRLQAFLSIAPPSRVRQSAIGQR